MKSLIVISLVVLLLVACAPSATPTPVPTLPPTPDLQATQAVMVVQVMATLTASAPTATYTPTVTRTPTETATPTGTATLTPTPRPTLTPSPVPAPMPTDEWRALCAGMPAGMVCLWVHNYRGGNDTITFNIADKAYQIPPGGDTIIFLQPGKYTLSFNIPKRPGGTATLEMPEPDRLWRYYFY